MRTTGEKSQQAVITNDNATISQQSTMPMISTGEATPSKQYRNEIAAHTVKQFISLYLNAHHTYDNIRQYINYP